MEIRYSEFDSGIVIVDETGSGNKVEVFIGDGKAKEDLCRAIIKMFEHDKDKEGPHVNSGIVMTYNTVLDGLDDLLYYQYEEKNKS